MSKSPHRRKKTGYMSERQVAESTTGYCADCEKIIFLSRSAARAQGKALNPHRGAYRCPANEQFWHLGRLKDHVRKGLMERELTGVPLQELWRQRPRDTRMQGVWPVVPRVGEVTDGLLSPGGGDLQAGGAGHHRGA